ncbi:aminoacyl-tRNA hydrolase [Aquibacillus sp. 3ASR75-11]|uniref:Peptidyl-tRNA hydrolase n=1 Tax=Terrihalobacillus insolitus TaxID=2950438 RepID=A0A9X3WUS3_9BACI|nr:aminoacyl-tRNA hydrolase [Terrihalobacillus insolitus]MDC3414866.1 aminoacyl-tRNA hydrolase [Terrihalobacillus insolitus]MDC3426015.1 aminoacyl-tRNA hydrolase [Terrihalobacillus insolitus]
MKCFVGLGNPGNKFKQTRHNVGFMVIDELARRNNWKLNKRKYNGLYAHESFNGEKVLLLEPQTYMNLSGEALRPLMDYYDIDISEIVVIYDDLDLPPGKIRLRQKGGHGGHNGIRNIINHLGTKDFKRIRVGIGRPTTPKPVVDYVLESFSKEEQEAARTSIDKAADSCEAWFQNPFQQVMNDFNQ